jgi:subtilisin-like proprotein convertase family protein
MKKLFFLAATAIAVGAQATIYHTNWTVNATIPDNNLSGWSDTRSVSTMPAGTWQGVAVNLQLSSDWVGDLYAYLVNDTGFVVLLDQVGQGTGSEPTFTYGYGAATWNITLANDGFNGGSYADIQTYGGGNLSGSTWNPASTDLTSFLSGSPNGTWSLFVADQSGGGLTTVQSWGLQMDIVAVPEVETWIAAALAGAFGAFWVNRQIWVGVKR